MANTRIKIEMNTKTWKINKTSIHSYLSNNRNLLHKLFKRRRNKDNRGQTMNVFMK